MSSGGIMRKKNHLFQRGYELEFAPKKLVIGVTGCDRGVGVTHFTFMLAAFLKQHLHKSVAVLDFSDGNDYMNLYSEYYSNASPPQENFLIHQIYFYPKINKRCITNVINENFDVIIIDFSTNMRKYLEEFLRCDEKYVVGSTCDWKIRTFEKFIEDSKHYVGNHLWKYLIPYAQEKELTWLRKEYEITTVSVPFNQNPFIVMIPALKQLQKLF